jgi:signal transduction histidine kinase
MERVVAFSMPNVMLTTADAATTVAVFFAISATVTAVYVPLFLLAFRRRYANRSAERLSTPLERLAATVRLAAAERDATRRAAIEGPAEVAQLAEDVNRLQEHLAQALAERDRVIGAQRDLVASLSHELRTPLAVLNGHAELLSRDAGSATRAQVMLRQLEDLHRLLSDLLDMTRLESIEATLAPQTVVLAAVVQEMVERFSAAAWRQGVVLRAARTPPPSLAAQADPRWLRQIVANLLSNAIRHTPQGGLVTLDIEQRDETVALVIEDTGIGLDTARAAQDLADRSAGIGLRLVRRLATAMRGSLRLEHTDEGGTRATVQLPAAPQR